MLLVILFFLLLDLLLNTLVVMLNFVLLKLGGSSLTARRETLNDAYIKIVRPVLRNLGWGDEEDEYDASAAYSDMSWWGKTPPKGEKRVRVLLVRVRAPGTNLDSQEEHHLLKAACSKGVRVCVLTTGREWRLYMTKENRPPESLRFCEMSVQDDPIDIDQITSKLRPFLSTEAVDNGAGVRWAENILAFRREPHRNTVPPRAGPPTGFVFQGQHHNIRYWNALVKGVAAEMYKLHPDEFEKENIPYISRSERKYCTQIGASEYWVYTHVSSKNAQHVAECILRHFGYPASDMEVVFDDPAEPACHK